MEIRLSVCVCLHAQTFLYLYTFFLEDLQVTAKNTLKANLYHSSIFIFFFAVACEFIKC